MSEIPLPATGMQSIRIFISYSSSDKHIAGELKRHLELRGAEVFLAHEDIEPCVEWQDDIIKNLRRCDVFVPLFTKEFKKSDYTDQEVGMAIVSDKFIIPLQTTKSPYGFINKIQSLKIDETFIENAAYQIMKLIKDKFGEDMKDFAINTLISSATFAQARIRVGLLNSFDSFSANEVNRILVATLENNQIHDSYGAREVLASFFNKHAHLIAPEGLDQVMILLQPPQPSIDA